MKKTILALALVCILSLAGCAGQGEAQGESTDESTVNDGVVLLSAEQAHERIQSGDSLIILDVRTADEYAEAHIPGAMLLPNEDIGDTPPYILPVRDAEILIYCRSGNRSAQAAQKLYNMGYTNVYDFGGINSWTFETESGEYSAEDKAGTFSSFLSYDLGGAPVDESVFAGYKLTMINIWGTFCGPCLSELPDLAALSAEYAGKGVRIVGIPIDVTKNADGTFSSELLQTARQLVRDAGVDYLQMLPSDDLMNARLNDVVYIPETIFVDSEGNMIGESYVGSRSGEAWAAIIDSLLGD